MFCGVYVLALFAAFLPHHHAAAEHASHWSVTRSAHFQIYSEAGPEGAKMALLWFEQLRLFFDRNHLFGRNATNEMRSPLTVVAFASRKQYSAYKLRATSDAYFLSMSDSNYIVMPVEGPADFGVAAHEYAHYLLHSEGIRLPSWLNEGLAELFSTVRINNQRCEMGGVLPVKVNLLRRHGWLPASEFFGAQADSPLRATADSAGLFYAQSWAVTDMLVYSHDYAEQFGDLITSLDAGATSSEALTNIFGKSQQTILHDAQAWMTRGGAARQMLPSLSPKVAGETVQELSGFESRMMLAQLLLTNGGWERAEAEFSELLALSPANAEILGALGTVRLYKGDRAGAMEYWRKALDSGVRDASLCYRYALLADEANYPPAEVARALAQAIADRPDFDDARYRLAILQSNGGDYSGAVEQLGHMAKPRASLAFAYWSTMAYALTQLERRAEAVSAARNAIRFATSPGERARASELAYVADTDIAVQFERGPDGQQRLVSTRIPHGKTDWNPFIEANDRLQTVEGLLREVQCKAGELTSFVVESKSAKILLAVPDPTHVLIRNGPSEFSCGPQPGKFVKVEYATTAAVDEGLLRGMEFR